MSTLREPNFFLNESNLNQISNDTKYIVYGYIRRQQNDSNDISQIIPKLITLIILAFYTHITDEFNPKLCGTSIQISNENTIITNKWGDTNTCYGLQVIASTSIGTYIWKIKLLSGEGGMNIGIDSAEGSHCNKNIYVRRDKCYAYCADAGYCFCWNKKGHSKFFSRLHKINDILTVTLKLTSNGGTLMYQINNEKEFIA